jgi:hypothetical protein
MKRKLFGGIAVLAIAAVAAWNVSFGSKTDMLSDVALANVEALASSETLVSCNDYCTYNVWYDCEIEISICVYYENGDWWCYSEYHYCPFMSLR